MRIARSLKCSFRSDNPAINYASLTEEELKRRRSSLLNLYLTSSILWSVALIITLITAKMSMPIIILYVGVIISLLLTSWIDYRRRVSLIDQHLKKR